MTSESHYFNTVPDEILDEEEMNRQYLENLRKKNKDFINIEALTERVRLVANKQGLENLQRTAINEVSYGVMEIMSDVIRKLIEISRQSRNMATVNNNRTTTEGQKIS